MTGFNRHAVVENMATLLDERRRLALRHQAAYVRLARAIVADELAEPGSRSALPGAGQPALLGSTASAA